MKILSRSGDVLFEADGETIRTLMERAADRGPKLWNAALFGIDLRAANLERIDLDGADLKNSNLRGANLWGADLRKADLEGADLKGANLGAANLWNANLEEANLSDANIRGAQFVRAHLRGATLPTGETWEIYLAESVPALLTAGGKTVAEVLANGTWDCHDWSNCPLRVALGISSEKEASKELRPQVDQFMILFGAGLIPEPETKER